MYVYLPRVFEAAGTGLGSRYWQLKQRHKFFVCNIYASELHTSFPSPLACSVFPAVLQVPLWSKPAVQNINAVYWLENRGYKAETPATKGQITHTSKAKREKCGRCMCGGKPRRPRTITMVPTPAAMRACVVLRPGSKRAEAPPGSKEL